MAQYMYLCYICITHTYSIWVTVIPEVVVLSVCVVLSFVVGVTISIGLRVTCDSLHQQDANQTRYVECHIPAEKLEVKHCSQDKCAPLLLRCIMKCQLWVPFSHSQFLSSCDREIPKYSHGIKFYSWMNSAQVCFFWLVYTSIPWSHLHLLLTSPPPPPH